MKQKKTNDVAIIGFSCRFPGAATPEEFWNNLKNGVCSITDVPEERWDIDEFYSPDIKDNFKTTSKYGGFIDEVYSFDAEYFRIQDKRAELMDPQQRLMLEVSAEAVNHAGYSRKELSGSRTSVLIAAGPGDYGSCNEFVSSQNTISVDGRILNSRNGFVGNIPSMISSSVSNHFNLMGSSFTLSSASSSSLLAIHLACQSISTGESNMVIAGGIQLYLSPSVFIGVSKIGALSADGKCRAFSHDADGYALSEGVGVCILKSLEKAMKDKDHIYSVIKSSAINNDGRTISTLMPSARAQEEVIARAMSQADIHADSIGYLEANGTAQKVGDPLEIRAATKAFQRHTRKKQYCAIGSVEPNTGHGSHVAGMVRLIKVILSLLNKQIPPTLYCSNPNPKIDFPSTPFIPNTKLIDWTPRGGCRRAGISCFGIGGTNSHLILEEFVSEIYNDFEPERKPLPRIIFNKKNYRIGHYHGSRT